MLNSRTGATVSVSGGVFRSALSAGHVIISPRPFREEVLGHAAGQPAMECQSQSSDVFGALVPSRVWHTGSMRVHLQHVGSSAPLLLSSAAGPGVPMVHYSTNIINS